MSTIKSKKDFDETPQPKAHYAISVAVFNQKSKKWEAAQGDVGVKTAKLIKDIGGLEAFAATLGESFALTEKGIYKKSAEGHWVIALTEKEMMESFPYVKEILETVAKRLPIPEDWEEKKGDLIEKVKSEKRKPKIVMEIRVSRYIREDLKELAEKLKAMKPLLAEDLLEKVETASEKELDQLVELAHTALYAEKEIPQLEFIGKGKAKEVYKFKGSKDVLIKPVSSALEKLVSSKEKEIKAEVVTAKHIERNLYYSYLIEILERNGIDSSEKIADAMINKWATSEEMIEAFDLLMDENELAGELNIELDLAKKLYALRDQFPEILEAKRHLAITMEEVTGSERLQGAYTVRAPFASGGDLESQIRKGNLPLTVKFQIISGILHGWANLHRAGYVWGDAKPENVLIFLEEGEILIVKLSDWGKTRPIKEGQQLRYTGNGRFMPPEKSLSKEGESYSAALLICRVLEEGHLNPNTRMINGEPEVKDKIEPNPIRQGIERFVVMNGALPQSEGTLRGKIRSYGPAILAPTIDQANAEKEISGYIDRLTATLQEEEGVPEEVINNLNQLLKESAASDPSNRPTMAEFAHRFDQIGIQLIS